MEWRTAGLTSESGGVTKGVQLLTSKRSKMRELVSTNASARGSHSFAFQLNVSISCDLSGGFGTRMAQIELRSERVEAPAIG